MKGFNLTIEILLCSTQIDGFGVYILITFQSRNRESFMFYTCWELFFQQNEISFNLAIESLLCSTVHAATEALGYTMFQSRNRESFMFYIEEQDQ